MSSLAGLVSDPDAKMISTTEKLRGLQRIILDRVSATFVIFGTVGVGVGVFDWWTSDRLWVIVFTSLVLVGSSAASLRRLDHRIRSALMLSVIFAASLAGFYFFGYLALPAISLVLAVFLTQALMGSRYASGAAISSGIAIVAIGALQNTGVLPVALGRELYAPEEFNGWVRVAVLFLVVSLAIVHVIRAQQNMLKASIVEQNDALTELRAKSDALERAHEERDNAEKRLLDAERLEVIGQLAGSVAHDMNNTLTVVLGSAEVLSKKKLAADDSALVEDVIQAAKNGSVLCRQLLSCARRSVLSPRNVEPSPFLAGVSRMFKHMLPTDACLAVEVDDNLPLIHIDEAELQHALLNLLSNARDAIGSGGVVTLRAMASEGKVWIEVEDDGVGIPESIRDRIFEPLFSTKSEGGGTGLGLPSVLGTVTQSGGIVELESELDRGTKVRLGFPSVEVVAPTPTSDATEPGRQVRILVVDDDPGIARLISRLLRAADVEPMILGDAEAALAELEAHDYDVLLTDVVLPGCQGPELAKRALHDWPDLRVVLMSGYMDGASAQVISDRKLPLVPKPFTAEELFDALNLPRS